MASKPGGLNERNDEGRERLGRSEVAERDEVVADTFGTLGGRPMPWGKKRVSAPRGTTVAHVQASGERLAEITSGRAISQRGLAVTCKDPPNEAEAEGGGREVVWRMSPYELRRRGNALRGGAGRHRRGGNTSAVQRGSRL